MYICIDVCMYICLDMYTCIYVYMHMYMYICIYICIYIYIHTPIYARNAITKHDQTHQHIETGQGALQRRFTQLTPQQRHVPPRVGMHTRIYRQSICAEGRLGGVFCSGGGGLEGCGFRRVRSEV